MEKEIRGRDLHTLFAQTLKMHRDSRVSLVPPDAMPERVGIEISAKLSIEAAEDVQIEFACNTLPTNVQPPSLILGFRQESRCVQRDGASPDDLSSH